MLHWLGGSAHTWDAVAAGLSARGVRCHALNLPGFGDAADVAGYTITAMADHVQTEIQRLRTEAAATGADDGAPWFLAGHSMGGKISAVLARRSLEGAAGLENLKGVVLVSPSPAGPEPMTDAGRAAGIALLGERTGDPAKDRRHAEQWVDQNTGKLPLPALVRELAVNGVLGMNRTAFRHWMERSSNEDWSKFVGKLAVPALVFAGTEEQDLGVAAQQKHTLPHFATAELVPLEAAGHLGPMERPGELIERLTQFFATQGVNLPAPQSQPEAAFESLMQGDHTSPKTLLIMRERLDGSQGWNGTPKLLSTSEFRTLRALVERVIPDAGFDLAARLDADIYDMKGDGWRYAVLPNDDEAWRKGLRSLDVAAGRAHGVPFTSLYPEQQDALLQQASAEKLGKGILGTLHLGEGAEAFSAEEMWRWFEDVRSECTRRYVADPRTMDRMGYTGFADDKGFTQIRLGETQEFER